MVLEFRSAQLSWSFLQQLATKTFPLVAILSACYCFVLPALLCCNVVFKVNLLPISLTYYPVCLWIFDFLNIMPSRSKSPQAPSTKTHSFLRKSTDESPSFKTTSTSVPSEVRSSGSLNPPTRWALGATSLIILRRTTSSPMTINPLKRVPPIGAGGMIPIHHSMKTIQASFRQWDHPFPLLPHSRELSKRRRSSRILIRLA